MYVRNLFLVVVFVIAFAPMLEQRHEIFDSELHILHLVPGERRLCQRSLFLLKLGVGFE